MKLNQSRVLDAGRWRPPQRVITTTNERGMRIEKIEKMPGIRSERWLNPAGMVVFLPLGCCNVEAEEGRVPYYEQKKRAKTAAGWIPWGRCPVALVASQELSSRNVTCESLLEQSPCMGAHGGKPISADNPCPHAQAEREYRKAVHNAREAAKQEAYKAEHEKDREQRDGQHAELIATMAKGQEMLADALKVQGRRGAEPK